jgi:hypothetical protein
MTHGGSYRDPGREARQAERLTSWGGSSPAVLELSSTAAFGATSPFERAPAKDSCPPAET